MASYQQFEIKNISIKYFKGENVLHIEPTQKTDKNFFGLLKNQLETMLSVDSLKSEPGGGYSMKLSQNSAGNVSELLRSLNAKGGEEVEDAQSLVDDSLEDKTENQQDQNLTNPAMGQAAGGAAPQMQMSALYLAAYEILHEGVFGKDKTFLKPKKPGRRTGKYWKPLERVTGKNRTKIREDDIKTKRKEFSRKPSSESRDKMLRALDKAFDYFYKKIGRDMGELAAERFAEEYYALDNLNPKDYALTKSKAEPISRDEEFEDDILPEPSSSPSLLDFSDIFTNKPSYNDIEIEEESF